MRKTIRIALLAGLSIGAGGLPALAASEAQQAFERLDRDGDGTIAWAEAYEVRVGQFTGMDADRDGTLIEAEFEGPARPLSAFDTDDDARLQLSEFLEGHRSMFQMFDADGDGALGFEEFAAARKAARDG